MQTSPIFAKLCLSTYTENWFSFIKNFANIASIVTCNFEYLPILDISVFVGPQLDKNEKKWFWNNRTMVSNAPSNHSVCQQMSWPLTYDDGKSLLPKDCDQDEAYFVCVQKCK